MIIPIGKVFRIPARVTWQEALTDELKLQEYIFQNTNMKLCYSDWEFPRLNPYREIWGGLPTRKEIIQQYKKDKTALRQGASIEQFDDPFCDGSCHAIGEWPSSPREHLVYVLKSILYIKQQNQEIIDMASSRLAWCENSLATKRHNKQYKAGLEATVADCRSLLDNPPPIRKRKEIRWRELLTEAGKWDEYLYQHAQDSHPFDDYSHPWHYWDKPTIYGQDILFYLRPAQYLVNKYEEARKLQAQGISPNDIDDPIYGVLG